ncbi:lantibiotic dehydratase [Myceligenerans pegani]|nr:lantibiotic dehydratase [Myceligenerans sp. TRM 65318]
MGRLRTYTWDERLPVLARIPMLPVSPGDAEGDVLAGPLLEAVRFASRSLGHVTSADLDSDDRLAATVRAYELRARMRATPRGAFAGVQVADVDEGPARFAMGTAHRARSMPSSAWLGALAARLVQEPGVLPRLRLTSNNLIVRRGDRYENEQSAETTSSARITLRATPAVSLILDACRNGASLGDVVTTVTVPWPQAPEELVRETVLEMVRRGHLLTDLLPGDVADDPLGHVLSRLPVDCELAEPLSALRKRLHEADLYPPGDPERVAALTAARDLCDTIARHEGAITVDVVADADIRLPARLVREAADVAGLLWSITPTETTLDSYHARFVEKYGTSRRVPLLDVVDPVVGLGDPEVDLNRGREEPDRRRMRVLAELVATAVADGGSEVVLDDATVAALRVPDDGVRPAPGGELYARVVAASEEDLVAGRYRLAAYFGCTADAGSSVGRFASLLPGEVRGLTHDESSALAEVVVRPRSSRLDTVAVPTGFASMRIGVGVEPQPGDLPLDDLEVASDGHHLSLWSRALDRQITPALYSRIGSAYIPRVARLLRLLARSGTRPCHTWSWGGMSEAMFLPRVRWRNTIVSPARWRLPDLLLTAAQVPSRWKVELDRWRSTARPRLPRTVLVENGDRFVPLDLDDGRDRELLRRYTRRGTDRVAELPGGPDAVQGVVPGPDGRHALELVIPLRDHRATAKPRQHPTPKPTPSMSAERVTHLPGGEWLSCVVAAPTAYHDELLEHVGELAGRVRDDVDRWFWLRYDSPGHGPHLRLRFAGKPEALTGRVLPAVSDWSAVLMSQGLVGTLALEPYVPEIDRYGGPRAIEAAEHVFHADGDNVLAALAGSRDEDDRLMRIAASAVEITRLVADGDLDALGRPRLDRTARRRVNTLRAVASAQPVGLPEDEREAWVRRAASLSAYRSVVPVSRRADCASSLIHMHANRMGADRATERIARALAVQMLAKESR